VPGQIFRELRFAFLRKHSHLEKKRHEKPHTHVYGVVSKNNVDYSERFLLSSHHEITGEEFKRKKLSVAKLAVSERNTL